MSANQGRYAEGKVQTFLTAWKAQHKGFTFNRILDAHASKGAMSNPQPGDFQWFLDTGYWIVPGMGLACGPGGEGDVVKYTRNGLIEVKSVQHEYRLPCRNFMPDQVARMRMRMWAGSEGIVLVCCHPAPREVSWRAIPLDFFEQRPGPKPEHGSWDLREIDAFTVCDDLLQPYLS